MIDRNSLSPLVRAYIECALWSTNDESTPSGGVPLDKNYSIGDIDEESLQKIMNDCLNFITQVNKEYDVEIFSDEFLGHHFWLTRNRHGTGFWDCGLGEIGTKLTVIAHSFGECWMYVDDDGKVYI